jgi:hypothetical protein
MPDVAPALKPAIFSQQGTGPSTSLRSGSG